MAALTLLCTTDLHGRLSLAQAHRLRALREERGALLVDCGDALTAPNVLIWPWTERVLTSMNAAGYAALGAGNREFFFRHRGLRHKTAAARFPILAANLDSLGGQPALTPHLILPSPAGDRVGFFGLMREMIRPGNPLEAVSNLRFTPWQAAARAQVEFLRPQVDWLVGLSHLGPESDEELAALCPELEPAALRPRAPRAVHKPPAGARDAGRPRAVRAGGPAPAQAWASRLPVSSPWRRLSCERMAPVPKCGQFLRAARRVV